MEMKKTEVKINKPIYLRQAILDLSKTLMYEFWYDYIKPKYGDKARLCYMDTDSFVIYIETEDFYKDIANDLERWFDTSKYVFLKMNCAGKALQSFVRSEQKHMHIN